MWISLTKTHTKQTRIMEDEMFPYLSECCKKFERSPRYNKTGLKNDCLKISMNTRE